MIRPQLAPCCNAMRPPTLVTSALRSLLSLGRPDAQLSALAQSAFITGRSSSSAVPANTPHRVWLPAPSPCSAERKHFAARAGITASSTTQVFTACQQGSAAASAVLSSSASSASPSQPWALPVREPSKKEAGSRWATAPARHSWLQRLPPPAARSHPVQPHSPSHSQGISASRWFATRSAPRPLPPPPLPPPKGSGIEGVKHIVAVASGKGGVGKSTTAGASVDTLLLLRLHHVSSTCCELCALIHNNPALFTLMNSLPPASPLRVLVSVVVRAWVQTTLLECSESSGGVGSATGAAGGSARRGCLRALASAADGPQRQASS